MSDQTPLEKLDDAIHEYIAATTPRDDTRTVSGWALGIETTAINSNPELGVALMDAQHYVTGPQTTSGQAIGLGRYVAGVHESYIINRTFNGD